MTETKYKLLDWIDESKLKWHGLTSNKNAFDLLLQNPDKIDKGAFSNKKCQRAMDYLEKHPEKINWEWLSSNVEAIEILKKNPDKIDYANLCINKHPDAIKIIEQNLNKANWWFLSGNPNAIPLLEQNRDKIDWERFSQNPSIFTEIEPSKNVVDVDTNVNAVIEPSLNEKLINSERKLLRYVYMGMISSFFCGFFFALMMSEVSADLQYNI
jgi:hypothetical protein